MKPSHAFENDTSMHGTEKQKNFPPRAHTTTVNLFQGICQMASEAGELVARLGYWVAGQPVQQPPPLIINQDGQPNRTASVIFLPWRAF
jgi:hypothetical protein